MNKPLDSLILTIRGQKVVLDADLAEIYGVPAKRLNEQVKRNADRFPDDFMFQLKSGEWRNLKSQIATSSSEYTDNKSDALNRSRFVTGSHGGRRTLPYAFTEHGALMAANVLNSPEAVKMSVYVVRAFIKQRELLMAQSDVLKKLAQMDAKLLQHDDALRVIWQELQPLLTPPPEPPKPEIGFHVKEDRPTYRARTRPLKKSR
jgi:hypothetical protein